MTDPNDLPPSTSASVLADDVQQKAARHSQPYWLGIAGPPGSGKSTLAQAVASSLPHSLIIPMDGYHLYRSQLDAMDDPAAAHARRGAPFTFDAQRFVQDLKAAKTTGQGRFPAFEHGTGDPVEEAIELTREIRIVLVEGNYLLLPQSPWSSLRSVFHETWFVDVPLDVCCERITSRHQSVGRTAQQAHDRVATNDRLNAELVISSCRLRADRRVRLADATGSHGQGS